MTNQTLLELVVTDPVVTPATTDLFVVHQSGDARAKAATATQAGKSLGVATTDTPQFVGIELGHASDTTLVRSGAGDVTIEGNAIYRAGGTDVPVADGGTGASTLTDGGVLLGSGTGAITAMAVLADSEMIVGDGTTDPVAESGATLRTSIGVGTTDDPSFNGLVLPLENDAVTPTLRFGDGNTGFYESGDNTISISINGAAEHAIDFVGIRAINANGYIALNEAASATNPTLAPNRSDNDTGIGWTSADRLALIAGGVMVAECFETSGADPQFILPQNNDAARPTLAFGDGNSGFYEVSDNIVRVSTGGTYQWEWTASGFNRASNAAGPGLLNEAATATNPTALPNQADLDTGIGWSAADSLSLIAGGAQAINFQEVGGEVQVAHDLQQGLTAGTTQTQAGGLALLSSYNSVTTVANVDDAVTLPTSSQRGALCTVVNAGANRLQIFPAVSDDLGAGVDTAMTLNAGYAVSFLMRDDNTNWQTLDRFNLSAHEHLVLPLVNDATTPTLAFGDGDSGFYESVDGKINVAIEGAAECHFNVNGINADNAAGFLLNNRAATATAPTLSPNKADGNTGIGWTSADRLSLVAGGVTVAECFETAGVSPQLIVPLSNTAALPTLAFGDGDTGFYEAGDDNFSLSIAGTQRWNFVSTTFRAALSGGPALQHEVASATNPTVNPNRDDDDTGIGWAFADGISLITGGVEAQRWWESSSSCVTSVDHNAGLTADVGSAQGSGTISSSYNVYSTVGTAGDSTTLPGNFDAGTLIYVKNDAATNSMDVFPASGDDAGAGADTAVAVAAGDFAVFFATTANTTWTKLMGGTA